MFCVKRSVLSASSAVAASLRTACRPTFFSVRGVERHRLWISLLHLENRSGASSHAISPASSVESVQERSLHVGDAHEPICRLPPHICCHPDFQRSSGGAKRHCTMAWTTVDWSSASIPPTVMCRQERSRARIPAADHGFVLPAFRRALTSAPTSRPSGRGGGGLLRLWRWRWRAWPSSAVKHCLCPGRRNQDRRLGRRYQDRPLGRRWSGRNRPRQWGPSIAQRQCRGAACYLLLEVGKLREPRCERTDFINARHGAASTKQRGTVRDTLESRTHFKAHSLKMPGGQPTERYP